MIGWCVMKFNSCRNSCRIFMILYVHVTLTYRSAGEATHLATDFKRICETYFPHTELAQIIARQHTGTPQAQHRVSMVKAAQYV